MADEVTVLLSDLEEFRATLNSTQMQNEAWDIFDNYRRLNGRFTWSAMTKQISGNVEKLDAYIEEAKEDDEDDESASTD